VIGVQFGGASRDEHYANMRAYKWAMGGEWLGRGAIDKDPKLEAALCSPGYSSDRHDKLVLWSRRRGLHSPGDADALILTFAQKVMPKPALPERWWARSLLYEWAGDDVWMRDSWLAYGEVSYCKNCPFVSERRRLSGRDPVTVANDHTIHHEYNILRNVGGVVANPS